MNTCILVADDDPDLRHYLRLTLQREGYEIIEADNGEQAIAHAIDFVPALILLDVVMPGLDGFATYRRLKSDARTHAVPVVFISARSDLRSRDEGLRLGAEDYLGKPLNPQHLSERVRLILQRRSINALFNSARSQNPV